MGDPCFGIDAACVTHTRITEPLRMSAAPVLGVWEVSERASILFYAGLLPCLSSEACSCGMAER